MEVDCLHAGEYLCLSGGQETENVFGVAYKYSVMDGTISWLHGPVHSFPAAEKYL